MPMPVPSVMTQPFWDVCRQHRLCVQRCEACGKLRFYPSAGCPHCASTGYSWRELSGRGSVYSWIVVDKTHHPYWQRRAPYVCAIVELEEQASLFMPGLLTDVPSADVRAGMPVEVAFEDASPEISLPRWRPAPTRDNR
jgi:uncharacterized OB-fold protein